MGDVRAASARQRRHDCTHRGSPPSRPHRDPTAESTGKSLSLSRARALPPSIPPSLAHALCVCVCVVWCGVCVCVCVCVCVRACTSSCVSEDRPWKAQAESAFSTMQTLNAKASDPHGAAFYRKVLMPSHYTLHAHSLTLALSLCLSSLSATLTLLKGEVGDWRNHFSDQQSQDFDCVYAEKLRGLGLTFDFGGGVVM